MFLNSDLAKRIYFSMLVCLFQLPQLAPCLTQYIVNAIKDKTVYINRICSAVGIIVIGWFSVTIFNETFHLNI